MMESVPTNCQVQINHCNR